LPKVAIFTTPIIIWMDVKNHTLINHDPSRLSGKGVCSALNRHFPQAGEVLPNPCYAFIVLSIV
jgi:hypothetical protein